MRSKIVDLEAKKQKIGKGEFLKNTIHYSNAIFSNWYYNYLKENNINSKSVDSVKIMEYLIASNKEKHFQQFADSLLAESNLIIDLKPAHYNRVNTDYLDFNELSGGKKIAVYIISDYNCPTCQNKEKRLRKIINKYGSEVSFRFVYISEYIDKKGIIAEAAANQGKFVKMHDFLFDHPEINGENQAIFEFAKKSGFNMEEFEKDILNPETMKRLMINKQKIITNKIYFTPSFIIDNKLVDDEFSLYTLERLIDEKLRNKN